jgi:hypothetical protein
MLEVHSVFPFSPSAFQTLLQTTFSSCAPRTTGAQMSNIKKSDVKNHLSPRFSFTIHLHQPNSQPDVGGSSPERPGNSSPTKNESIESPLNLSSTSGRAFRNDGLLDDSVQLEPRLRRRELCDVIWRYFADRGFQVDHAKIIWPNWLPRVLWFRRVCPCCESVHFRSSEAHSLDQLCSLFALRPIRCTFCWRRYYWFSFRGAE